MVDIRLDLRQFGYGARTCLPRTMELAEEHSDILLEQLSSVPDGWDHPDRLFVLLKPESLNAVRAFYDNNGPQLIEICDDDELRELDQSLRLKLEQLLKKISMPVAKEPKREAVFVDMSSLAAQLLKQYEPVLREMLSDQSISKAKRIGINDFLIRSLPAYSAMVQDGSASLDATAKLLQKAYDLVGHRRRHRGYFDPVRQNAPAIEILQRHVRGVLTCTPNGFRFGKHVLHDVDI